MSARPADLRRRHDEPVPRRPRWSRSPGRSSCRLLVLGPALGWGYVLSYDMVWVPRLDLRADTLGLGTRAAARGAVRRRRGRARLRRARGRAPEGGAARGAGRRPARGPRRSSRDRSTPARLVAATVAVWNPFVVERLVLGPLAPARRVRRAAVGGRRAPRRPRRATGCRCGSRGCCCSAASAPAPAWRPRSRPWPSACVAAIPAAPSCCWAGCSPPTPRGWSPGWCSRRRPRPTPPARSCSPPADEGLLPGPLAVLSFGGVWNAEVVPGLAHRLGRRRADASCSSPPPWSGSSWCVRRRVRVAALGGLLVCWAVGTGLAVLSWAAPGALGWLAAHVPGGGLVRDGSRLLGLAVPLVVVLVAVAVDALLERLPDHATRALVGGVLALVPLSLMPDAAWGAGGRLDGGRLPRGVRRRACGRLAGPGRGRGVAALRELPRPGVERRRSPGAGPAGSLPGPSGRRQRRARRLRHPDRGGGPPGGRGAGGARGPVTRRACRGAAGGRRLGPGGRADRGLSRARGRRHHHPRRRRWRSSSSGRPTRPGRRRSAGPRWPAAWLGWLVVPSAALAVALRRRRRRPTSVTAREFHPAKGYTRSYRLVRSART